MNKTMQRKVVKIFEEDVKAINELAQGEGISQSQIIHNLLNDTHEVKADKPNINACLWSYYYSKQEENGKWSKVDQCPLLNTFPDIVKLGAKERVQALMKGCSVCLLKEKALRKIRNKPSFNYNKGYTRKTLSKWSQGKVALPDKEDQLDRDIERFDNDR